MRSFLVTDFGMAHTRTVLIDQVAGQYRLIAGAVTRSTALAPLEDVTVSLIRSLQEVEALTQRRLFSSDTGLIRTQSDGSGFDEFLATASSAGRPLRAVIVALMDDFSLASAKRALTGTYIEAVATLTLVDLESEEKRINTILNQSPDVIFIVGGTNNGNEEHVRYLIRLVDLAFRLLPVNQRPIILYAGNERLRQLVRARFSEMGIVLTADNVRPEIDMENLSSAKIQLARVFDNFLRTQVGSFGDVSEFSEIGITPSAQSAARVVRYLDSFHPDSGCLYLDIGSGTSTLISSFKEVTSSDIRSNLGLGHHATEILRVLDWRDVARWLPFSFSLEGLEEWVANQALAPVTVSQTLRELLIEQAVIREIVRLMLKDTRELWREAGLGTPHFSPIIVGGFAFTSIPPRLAALLILDALEPIGHFEIWLDPYALASALGVVGYREAMALVQVIDNGGFTRLGTVFCPTGGRGAIPRRAQVTITLADGKVMKKQVSAGEIWMPELAPNQWIELEIKLSGGLSLNGASRFRDRVKTGLAGIVIDLRGRPISLASGRKRAQILSEWFSHATGVEIDDRLWVTDEQTELRMGHVEVDFPSYERLPAGELDPAIEALLAAPKPKDDLLALDEDDLFGGPSPDFDDLRKGLGL